LRRIALRSGAVLAAVVLIGMGSAAYAHIQVSSADATPGAESAKLVFRVPTESDTASTTSVTITLPAKTPFAYVSAQTKPGWKVAVDTRKLAKPAKVGEFTVTKAVRSVTWTANAGGVAPNEFDEFALAVGPVPDADKITFVAAQKYSDGQVVTWDQIQKGDKEPEHPAPSFELAAPPKTDADRSTRTADWLAGSALVVAVATAVVVLRQNRRRA
jgi:uncharacterized protein YcnI